MRRIWWALALLIAWPASSQALCSGQSAAQWVLLEDNFADMLARHF
jgi:hypothetical protein